MASEEVPSETLSSLFERLVRLRDLSLFIPFMFGLTDSDPRTDPDQGPETTQRLILINPLTQGMVVIDGASSLGKKGQPPASKAAIEALESVEVEGGCGEECSICLEEFEGSGLVKEMPCKHRFHGGCVERWLGIHGSCPVCRYKMPVEDEGEEGKGTDQERREIWVSFSFNGLRRSEDLNQSADGADDSFLSS